MKYGYANVGEVEEGPADLRGRLVFTLFPHQTRYVVPVHAPCTCCRSATPPARAVLAANLETAINGVWDARPLVGDRVAVVGAGAVGCLTAWLVVAHSRAARSSSSTCNPARAGVARALGVRFATAGRARRARPTW